MPPSQKVWVAIFIVSLVSLGIGLGIYAAVRKREKTPCIYPGI